MYNIYLFILWTQGGIPDFYCPPWLNGRRQGSAPSVISMEALSYRQDYHSSFKYYLQCVVSPGEEKDPRPDTKKLLSAAIKA